MWVKVQKFGQDNWKFLLVMVLIVVAMFWYYPVIKKFAEGSSSTAATPDTVEADAVNAESNTPDGATAILPRVPEAKRIGAASDDLAQSYRTVDFEGQKKGMAMQGITFMSYAQLMDFAHDAIAEGAKNSPVKKSKPNSPPKEKASATRAPSKKPNV